MGTAVGRFTHRPHGYALCPNAGVSRTAPTRSASSSHMGGLVGAVREPPTTGDNAGVSRTAPTRSASSSHMGGSVGAVREPPTTGDNAGVSRTAHMDMRCAPTRAYPDTPLHSHATIAYGRTSCSPHDVGEGANVTMKQSDNAIRII